MAAFVTGIQVGLLLLSLRFSLACCFCHWDSGSPVAFVAEIWVGLLLLLLRFRLACCFCRWDSGWPVAFVTVIQVDLLLLSLRFRLACVAYGFFLKFPATKLWLVLWSNGSVLWTHKLMNSCSESFQTLHGDNFTWGLPNHTRGFFEALTHSIILGELAFESCCFFFF